MRDYFDVLGVQRKYHFSDGELEKRFLERSKQVHPDRFARAPAAERVAALQKSTELNDAYRVLKHHVRRAEYLLKLEGLDVADEKSESVRPDPALLAEMMELNEELADARESGDRTRIGALEARVGGDRSQALATVDDGFRAWEAGDRAVLARIAQALVALRYYARFLEQAEGKEGDL